MLHWNRENPKCPNKHKSPTSRAPNPEPISPAATEPNPKAPSRPKAKPTPPKNSLKHGLLARTVVLPNESKDRFVRLFRSLQKEFQPATAVQRHLVETMTVARWRQLRTWGLENSAIGYQLRQRAAEPAMANEDDNTQTTLTLRDFTAQSRYLDHINRFENRFDRQYDRALRRLLALQTGAQTGSQAE